VSNTVCVGKPSAATAVNKKALTISLAVILPIVGVGIAIIVGVWYWKHRPKKGTATNLYELQGRAELPSHFDSETPSSPE